ncbi:MAG TPA: LPS export ABC transporter permease LptF [Quisquiliibacterium sp.]|nr:LPS export ABC transporter permease LptF [Quisquiliibacterium sp.]
MLFTKALRRDLANLAGVVFATLFTVMVTTTLIRMLGRAAGGKVDTASLVPLIAFSAIGALPVLLVLTLYISVLLAITRAYRDSEMVVWFASGRSLVDWIRPVLVFAAPFVLLVAVVAFVAGPWASRQTSEYRSRFEQREDVSQVAAGQFRESASSSRVFFVESLSEDQRSVRNVFVTQEQAGRLTIVVAASGGIEDGEKGDRFLVLEKGRRYDGDAAASAFRLMEFERYGLRLEPKASAVRDLSAKARGTLDLLSDPTSRNLGELLWRIGLPVSAVVLALLAIPLSSFNPRAGRSVNLIVALLVYVTYSNLLSLSQAWVAQEKLSFGVAVWAIHAVLIAVAVLLFWRRLTLARVRLPWRRRAAA